MNNPPIISDLQVLNRAPDVPEEVAQRAVSAVLRRHAGNPEAAREALEMLGLCDVARGWLTARRTHAAQP